MIKKNILATVDLGSNSFHLLLANIDENGNIFPIDRIKETVRLGGGLDANNYLTSESQTTALAVLARFNERLIELASNQVRVVGTSALRIAHNAQEFIHLANKVLGFNIEVLSGQEEARLIYIGAAHSMKYTQDKRLVIDIGGGSTEFIIGSGYEPLIMESVTMGCVSFTNRYCPNGVLSTTNLDNAIFEARSKIQTMKHLFMQHEWTGAIGTSGTAKALYDLCVTQGDQNITLDGLYKIKKQLLKFKNIKALSLTGLKDDRVPVIAGGLAIMIAIFEELQIAKLTVTDGSLREGVMYDLLGRNSNIDMRANTILWLQQEYVMDIAQANRVATTADYLVLKLINNKKFDENLLKLFNWAVQLYEIGLKISHNDYHKHGAYIVANIDMNGFSQSEQDIISNLILVHRGSFFRASRHLQEHQRIKTSLLIMVLAFRLAVIFNRNRKPLVEGAILDIKMLSRTNFELIVNKAWINQNPLTLHSLNEEISQWARVDLLINLIQQ